MTYQELKKQVDALDACCGDKEQYEISLYIKAADGSCLLVSLEDISTNGEGELYFCGKV